MRFIIAEEFYHQMLEQSYHPPDCYVRDGEYLHHMYIDGVKYTVAQAVFAGLAEAESRDDVEAIDHLTLHRVHYEMLLAEAERIGPLEGVTLLGDAPPTDEEAAPVVSNMFTPRVPTSWEELGLSQPFLFDMILRTIYTNGQTSGGDLADILCIPFPILNGLAAQMRRQSLIDIANQRGNGDSGFVYDIKPPKGTAAVEEAMSKTAYVGPVPVPFADYAETVMAQTIRKLIVTRRSIRKAFEDLVISESSFNEIGPAVNSTSSIFFFGYPGNGKTSIAERIIRLMNDTIYIPHAIEANGQIIKVYDPILHTPIKKEKLEDGFSAIMKNTNEADRRFVKSKRPTIVVGGELTMSQLDLLYNEIGKFYEAPLQMKANGGIFMIDDFGRQQVRPMDLLNRWIVPLEKKFDYISTITGTKVEIPFDVLLIFSTNLDPNQLADEAFLRRIKFKIEVKDPDEGQYRRIWELVCQHRKIEHDQAGIDYLINKWYRPTNRPFRMCQPRDLLDQMSSIAKYNMERVNFSPDLIDAACETYFISQQKKDFGVKMNVS